MYSGSGGDGGAALQNSISNQQLNAGDAIINSMFNGGTYGVNPASWQAQTFVGVPGGLSTDQRNASGIFDATNPANSMIPGIGFALDSSFGDPFVGDNQTSWLPKQWLNGYPQNEVGKLPQVTRNIPVIPGQTYYNAQGQPIKATTANYEQLAKMQAAGTLFTGTATSKGFGDDFYNAAGKAYTDYATPQVEQQFQNTNKNLTYALARSGLLNSGAAVQRRGSLNQELNTNLSNVANTALDQENTLRSNVANQENQLLSQVEAGAKPSQIASQAAAATANLRAPTALPPIGNLFSDWSNAYLTNMENNLYNTSNNNGNLFQLFGMQGYGSANPASSSMVVN